MSGEKGTLCFVVCPPFHGATLLALLLNNHSSISALGDTNPSRRYDQVCSCSEPVSECAFWRAAAERIDTSRFRGLNNFLPILPWPLNNHRLEGQVPLRLPISAHRGVEQVLSTCDDALSLLWRARPTLLENYLETWTAFYDFVGTTYGTQVIVDGSKASRKIGLFTRLAESYDVKVIHLVRDPRGFAASWWRNNGRLDPRLLGLTWTRLHARLEGLQVIAPYKCLRYEDLALRPETAMESMLRFLDLPLEVVVRAPHPSASHHLMGNSMVFRFDGEVRMDERWSSELTPSEQQAVLTAAGGVADGFGYGWQ